VYSIDCSDFALGQMLVKAAPALKELGLHQHVWFDPDDKRVKVDPAFMMSGSECCFQDSSQLRATTVIFAHSGKIDRESWLGRGSAVCNEVQDLFDEKATGKCSGSLLESIQAKPVEGNFVKLLLTASVKKLSILKVIVRELADLGADQLAMIRVGRSSVPVRFWDSEAAFRDDNGLEPDSGGSGRRGAGGRSGLGGAEFDALKAQSAAMQLTMQTMTVELANSQKQMDTQIEGVVSSVSAVAEFTSARILEVTDSQAKMAQDMAVNLENSNSDTQEQIRATAQQVGALSSTLAAFVQYSQGLGVAQNRGIKGSSEGESSVAGSDYGNFASRWCEVYAAVRRPGFEEMVWTVVGALVRVHLALFPGHSVVALLLLCQSETRGCPLIHGAQPGGASLMAGLLPARRVPFTGMVGVAERRGFCDGGVFEEVDGGGKFWAAVVGVGGRGREWWAGVLSGVGEVPLTGGFDWELSALNAAGTWCLRGSLGGGSLDSLTKGGSGLLVVQWWVFWRNLVTFARRVFIGLLMVTSGYFCSLFMAWSVVSWLS